MARERKLKNLDLGDLYTPSEKSKVRSVVTPRIIALTPDGSFPMLNLGGWLGLPGGKVKKAEIRGNLLSEGAFATLTREISEECVIDMSPYWGNSACLGLAEVTEVNALEQVITERFAPIFICKIPKLAMSKNVIMANIHSRFPGPLYPDARMAITYLQHRLAKNDGGVIKPEFLNLHGKCYFQTHPTKGYLWGRPSWDTYLLS